MANAFHEIKRVFVCQQNSLVTSPSTVPTVSPFPIGLASNATVNLCEILVPLGRVNHSFMLNAVVNWSMTSTQNVAQADFPGIAQITFEFLRDGVAIYRVIDTLLRTPIETGEVLTTPTTTFGTATLLHVNEEHSCPCLNKFTQFTLRATNTFLSPSAALTTASVGAVTFKIEELACR